MEGDQEVEVSGNNQVDMDLVGEAMEERRVCIKGNITQLEEMIIKIGEVLGNGSGSMSVVVKLCA